MVNTKKKVVDLDTVGLPRSARKPAAKPRAPSTRVGWTPLSEAESKRPGAALLALLLEEANRRGLQLQELAAELECTYGYLAQLRSGLRPIPNISDEFAAKCAKFLRLPRLTILAAAEILRLSDFYEPVSLELQLDQALRVMMEDPNYAGFVPQSIWDTSDEIKLFTVRLYEKASGRRVMPDQVGPSDVAGVAIAHPPALK